MPEEISLFHVNKFVHQVHLVNEWYNILTGENKCFCFKLNFSFKYINKYFTERLKDFKNEWCFPFNDWG